MSVYRLIITFKSNERPFSTNYTPITAHQPKDDEAAIKWTNEMIKGLGDDYIVTLFKDNQILDLEIL